MCLNELDLSQFLSENSPVPHDVNFEVFDNFTSSETFKAHRYQIFMLKYNHYAQHKYPLEGTFKETLTNRSASLLRDLPVNYQRESQKALLTYG